MTRVADFVVFSMLAFRRLVISRLIKPRVSMPTIRLATRFVATHQGACPPESDNSYRHSPQPTTSNAPPSSPSSTAAKKEMFCYQCEQTRDGTGCTTVGVCGKTPSVSVLQDLLMHCVKGISQYAHRAAKLGVQNREVDRFVLSALFSTLTNVNFDDDRFVEYLRQAERVRDMARDTYVKAAQKAGVPVEEVRGPAEFTLASSMEELIAQGKKYGIPGRKRELGEDVVGLQEMAFYGIKGAAAYAEHAMLLGNESDKIYEHFHKCIARIVEGSTDINTLLADALDVGLLNYEVQTLLDNVHVQTFGHPSPTVVNTNPVEGKCILISGHDLHDVNLLLKQTEGKGINVYTHGENLPAHGYPGLRKYKHLVGNFGGAWQVQRLDFSLFPGSIIMTSNCITEPKKSYRDRLFTRHVVGWPGVQHIQGDDFTAAINKALELPGFNKENMEDYPKRASLTVGFGRHAVLSVADKVIDAVKSGAIKRFFFVGGCDGTEGERNYFREVAKQAPKESIFLTAGCGKFRINNLPLGDIGGIPRVLDCGQCNDSYSAIQIALGLAKAFKTDVNSLPLSFAVSWFEQKAVACLLTLLYLNIKNIRLGPNLPGFATPNMLKILNEKFNLKPIGKVEEDMKAFLQNQ